VLGAAFALAIAAVVVIVLRDADRSDAYSTTVSAPPGGVTPTFVGNGPVRFSVKPAPVGGRGYLYVQVGTYATPAKDTIRFSLLDGRGARVAHCVYPPTSYHDNQSLVCPVPDISQVHALVVTRTGKPGIALSASGKYTGYLARDEASSLTGRIWTVLSRVATSLPDGVGASILLVALFATVVLSVLGVAFAAASDSADGEGSERADDIGDGPAPTPAEA
jgi:hypothetical protein